jgi:hypothetical protein
MSSALHCHLLVPFRAIEPAAEYPSLRALLRFAQREAQQAGDAAAWLCALFGVERQQDMPVAPFAALGDDLGAEDGYWLRADPVSLLLQRDSFGLMEAPQALQAEQARQLAASLNAHFAADGMQFHVAAPHRWYLRLADKPDLRTHSLAAVLQRDIQPFLPSGANGLHWHRQLNELQMLLHAHPVNAALEEQGVLPVNSVWLWGGGELRGGPGTSLHVWADEPLARGLALAHGNRLAPLSASMQEWLERAEDAAAHLAVLPQLSPQLEHDWFAPLLDAVRSGRIGRVTLHLAGDDCRSYSLSARDFLKFWRRARPLEHYLG